MKVAGWNRISSVVRFGMTVALAGMLCNTSNAADTLGIDKLEKNASIYASLPQKIKDAGVIRAATESDYPPFDFLDDHNQLIGADIDISRALGRIMGVTIQNTNTDFSAIIPGLQSGRFDVGISSIGDYTEREKTMDFVDYYRGGTSFLIRNGTTEPKAIADLCGTTVGVLKGTSSETLAQSSSDRCKSMGKPAITVNAYPTQSAAVLALTSGRIQSVSGDSATNGYSASNASLKIRNGGLSVYQDRPYYGIAIPKDSPLVKPFMDAMDQLIKSGVYTAIVRKWGISDGAIAAPLKNQGIAQ
ncbi:ABC transporter substrate-binding protein [Paraburkholderia nodosa]|uniref:ABC transporter substrate-binding protein n=1 Tax=Paraburkholderia nodosa TaxID=392320 RepID=UPI0004B1E754|nr:ABC transporter substrate-binding protein [Paraburkholderia nodosa]